MYGCTKAYEALYRESWSYYNNLYNKSLANGDACNGYSYFKSGKLLINYFLVDILGKNGCCP